MKELLLLFLFILSPWIFSFSQDVQFASAVISAGGGSVSTHEINLTRWRIGEVHVVTFTNQEISQKQAVIPFLPDEPESGWSVYVYPNPFSKLLKIRFDTEETRQFAFEISDMTGRKLIAENARLIIPGQVEELDLSELTPAMYLLKVIPTLKENPRFFKITKQ